MEVRFADCANEKLSYNKKTSGIYCIVNKRNGKHYVGSSVQLYMRISSHRSYLKRGLHSNIHLQRGFDKYGEENFYVLIVEICGSDETLNREQAWLDLTTPEYNIAKVAGSPTLGLKASPKTREKISEALKRRIITDETRKKLSDSWQRRGFISHDEERLIHQFDLQCNHIATYDSIVSAAKANNCGISRIVDCVAGVTSSTLGFVFSKGSAVPKPSSGIRGKRTNGTVVEELNDQGIVIAEYPSVCAATRAAGLPKNALFAWLNGSYTGKRKNTHSSIAGRFRIKTIA